MPASPPAAARFQPLIPGRLERRYKRFLADATINDGETITAHCANPGAMTGLADPGTRIWLSSSNDPKRKLAWSWQLSEPTPGVLVGVNTGRANAIVADALAREAIPALSGYRKTRREVPYGTASRIDFLLEEPVRPKMPAAVWLEVKSVTLSRQAGVAEFPDAATARGVKHLNELAAVAANGGRAVVFYLVQRGDCDRFRLASDIDPAYARAAAAARDAGVEVLCYGCRVTRREIRPDRALPTSESAESAGRGAEKAAKKAGNGKQ